MICGAEHTCAVTYGRALREIAWGHIFREGIYFFIGACSNEVQCLAAMPDSACSPSPCDANLLIKLSVEQMMTLC